MELQDPFCNVLDFDFDASLLEQPASEVPMENAWILSCRSDLVKEIFRKSLELIVTTPVLSPPVVASYQVMLLSLQYRYDDVQEFVNEALVIQLMKLTRRPSSEEREMVLYLLHKVYSDCLALRITIRQHLARDFANFVDGSKSDRSHPGIKDLLSLLQSIVSGFQTPLKEAHTKYFQESVLPLFLAPSLDDYGQELLVCVAHFIQKERPIIIEVIRFLMDKFSTAKQTDIILTILADIIPCLSHEEFSKIQVNIYTFLVSCAKHQQLPIAEAGIAMMTHPTFLERLKLNIAIAYPMLCTPLQQNAVCHWNTKINQLSGALVELLREFSRVSVGAAWSQPRFLY